MSTTLWVCFTAFEVVCLLACWRAAQLWANTTRVFDEHPKRRVSVYPLTAVSAAVLVLLVMILGALPDDLVVARGTLAVLVIVGAAVSWGLSVSLRRMGRPARLIPPHLRTAGRRLRDSH